MKPKSEKISQIKGTWEVEIQHKDGKVEKIGPKSNLIVATAKVLLAALYKNDTTYTSGVMYHAVGAGDPLWDTGGTPSPSYDQTTLTGELDPNGRKIPSQITYLDDDGNPTMTPTATIQVVTVYTYSDLGAPGRYLREHGLFGGNATSTKDSGLLIDVIHMARIWKDETVQLTFKITLEF